ncbi:FCD domain-containing protein [Roseomonas sp. NAR14]|uniref:Pyruvate dehydrogenase complex repressor n=1 Tax=Roseomonas acroporae TaxID=2937791 RepID=A0A9X2BUQ8_9PROT|nr:FCD domain-containing protein [Roseomonas acroporae]MCK8785863.1 FCD domain-containing protein [Roseomonas acroporae]
MTTPPRPGRTAATVARHIEDLIREGSLRPGEKLLPEREVAERLAVSRPTLREGIGLLESKGLLIGEPGGATRVAPLGAAMTDPLVTLLAERVETTYDYLEFREIIEGSAARLAAERATEVDLDTLRRCLDRMTEAHGKADPTDEAAADVELHVAIYEATHNVVLLHIMRALAQMLRANVFYSREKLYSRPEVRDLLFAQHRAIHDAILARDAAGAQHAAERHIGFTHAALKQIRDAEARLETSLRRIGSGRIGAEGEG